MKETRTFNYLRETPKKRVFAEAPPAGKPPIIENLYLPKWFIGDANRVVITVETNVEAK